MVRGSLEIWCFFPRFSYMAFLCFKTVYTWDKTTSPQKNNVILLAVLEHVFFFVCVFSFLCDISVLMKELHAPVATVIALLCSQFFGDVRYAHWGERQRFVTLAVHRLKNALV